MKSFIPPEMENLPVFSRGDSIFSSAAPARRSGKGSTALDLADFVSIAQRCNVDFLPISWHEGLEPFGRGGSADISQSTINIKTNFVFKRFVKVGSSGKPDLRFIAMELLVLINDGIRKHSNIVDLIGICWEVQGNEKLIQPVLIFPKAPLGDLSSFLLGSVGKDSSIETRLNICADVAKAIGSLHSSNIKPVNVLIFENDDGKPLAKVIDFAYSCIGQKHENMVYLPQTSEWVMAPEWHHRGFSIDLAKRLDVFSFGILSAWVLFRDEFSHRAEKLVIGTTEELLLKLKKEERLLEALVEVIRTTVTDGDDLKDRLEQFFSATVAHDPIKRECNFKTLIALLSRQEQIIQINNVAFSAHEFIEDMSIKHVDRTTSSPHIHVTLNIPKSMLQFTWADYRLRNELKKLLEMRASGDCPECQQHIAFQLAICYHTGFGTSRNEENRDRWLLQGNRTLDDLQLSLGQLEKGIVFRPGAFLDLWMAGSITPNDIVEQYRRDKLLSPAQQQYQREIADLEVSFGTGHFLVSTVQSMLANTFRADGKLLEAMELYQQALNARQLDVGPQDPSLLSTMLSLASVLEERGMWAKSETQLRNALDIAKKSFPRSHPAIVMCLADLASVLGKFERWEEAERFDREVVTESLNYFGKDHPNSIKAIGNLAVTLAGIGKNDEAEQLDNEVLQMSRQILGENHPDTLTATANLAKTYGAQNRRDEAEDLLKKTLFLRESILGPLHYDTLRTRADLAANYIQQGKWNEGEAILIQLLPVATEVWGELHPEKLSIDLSLIELFRRQSRIQEAYDRITDVVDRSVNEQGLKHPTTMRAMALQARILRDGGHIGYASDVLWDLVNLNLEAYGPANRHTLSTTHLLAFCLHDKGDLKGAFDLMKETLKRKEEVLGKDHPDSHTAAQVLSRWESEDRMNE